MKEYIAIVAPETALKILRGEKTIETRFGRNRKPVASNTQIGDIIYFKAKGGDIVLRCEASAVVNHELNYSKVADLESELWESVHGKIRNADYWESHLDSKFLTLVHLSNVVPCRIYASELPRNLPYASAWIGLSQPLANIIDRPTI